MGDHYYLPDGTMVEGLREARKAGAYPSVTTVLRVWPQDGLKKWLRGMDILSAHTTLRLPTESDDEWTERVIAGADEESAKARDTGTRRHAIIEQFNKGQLKIGQHDPKDLAHCQPYFDWHTKNVQKVRYAERIVVNNKLGYAGTLDLDCFVIDPISKSPALIDVKNRKRLGTYDTDCMQLCAYAMCENSGALYTKLISIVLGTERQEILVHEWTPEDKEQAWKNFKLCLEMWCASREYWPAAKM